MCSDRLTEADDPVYIVADDPPVPDCASWNHCCDCRSLYICGNCSTNVTAWLITSGRTSQSMPTITSTKRMMTVTIAMPRFRPRRWNQRTSGSRPSVTNVAAKTENSTLDISSRMATGPPRGARRGWRRRPIGTAGRRSCSPRAPAAVPASDSRARRSAFTGVSLGVRMPRATEARRRRGRREAARRSGVSVLRAGRDVRVSS